MTVLKAKAKFTTINLTGFSTFRIDTLVVCSLSSVIKLLIKDLYVTA